MDKLHVFLGTHDHLDHIDHEAWKIWAKSVSAIHHRNR
jgi:hypothetical protein